MTEFVLKPDEFRPGDRVRVEFEGTVRASHPPRRDDKLWVMRSDGGENLVSIDSITRVAPAEPPDGSVVIVGTDKVAWQRRGHYWYGVADGSLVEPWTSLSSRYPSTLRVVYIPDSG